MSIFDRILVAIDDKDLTMSELDDIFSNEPKSLVYSSLAKIEKKNLISRTGSGFNKKYIINKTGAAALEIKLNILRDFIESKEFGWLIVSVSISDKFKKERERIRRNLNDLGFGLINRGVYLGKIKRAELVKNILKPDTKKAVVYYFHVANPELKLLKNYSKYWKVDDTKKQYVKWAKQTQTLIKSLSGNDDRRRILAKIQIIELANIVSLDPKINRNLFTPAINKLYKKLRANIR